MKPTSKNKLLSLALAGGSIAFLSVYALETKFDAPANVPGITVDANPLNRQSTLPASFSTVIKKVTPSVVKIAVTGKAQPAADFQGMDQFPFDQFGGQDLRRFFGGRQGGSLPRQFQPPRSQGAASGVVVTPDGYILTNNHVVEKADKVEVTFTNGRTLTGKVIGTDPKTDLAVLKVDAKNLPAITFADSAAAEVGDVVLAIGNPFGLGQSVTMGMISATGRASLGLDYEDFIQTDAAINPGNSGGALVDSEGRLVGINTAILSRGGGNDGVGFSIPSNMARNVMSALITDGKVDRAYLGVLIQNLTPSLARQFKADENVQGALVGDVPAKTPAAKAGIEAGDIITNFAGKPVTDARGLKLAVANHRPGEKAEVKVLRNGEEKTLIASLEAQPDADKSVKTSMKDSSSKSSEGTLRGVGVADLDNQTRREAGIPRDVQGALVTDVEESSAAWEAGLRPGDVIEQINREPVASSEDAVKLTEAPATQETLVRVWSKGSRRFLTVDETQKQS